MHSSTQDLDEYMEELDQHMHSSTQDLDDNMEELDQHMHSSTHDLDEYMEELEQHMHSLDMELDGMPPVIERDVVGRCQGSLVQSIAKRRKPLGDITNSRSTRKSTRTTCMVCHIKCVTYSGMRCAKCARETGLPTDPDERLKQNNARHNPINDKKVSIYLRNHDEGRGVPAWCDMHYIIEQLLMICSLRNVRSI